PAAVPALDGRARRGRRRRAQHGHAEDLGAAPRPGGRARERPRLARPSHLQRLHGLPPRAAAARPLERGARRATSRALRAALRPPRPRRSREEALLRRELSARVRRAVGGLPVQLREPVLLRFFREMPHRDIAEELKLSSDNVRKRLQYARDILGRRLERHVTTPAAVPTSRAIPSRVRPAPRSVTSLAD